VIVALAVRCCLPTTAHHRHAHCQLICGNCAKTSGLIMDKKPKDKAAETPSKKPASGGGAGGGGASSKRSSAGGEKKSQSSSKK
jgi:hypothetical protein